MAQVGWRSLERARAEVQRAVGDDVPTQSQLFVGGRVHGLVEHSDDAELLVLGRHRRSAVEAFLGSVGAGTAMRAHCPVAFVPEGWDGGGDHVVVGVEDVTHSAALVAAGFRTAQQHGLPLVVRHAWRLSSPYDDLVLERTDVEAWQHDIEERVDTALAPWRTEHPEVRVTIDVPHVRAVEALAVTGEGAAHVLVGRRGRGAPWGFHLGAVARGVIAHAECPVTVVPLHARPDEDLVGVRDEADELAPQY